MTRNEDCPRFRDETGDLPGRTVLSSSPLTHPFPRLTRRAPMRLKEMPHDRQSSSTRLLSRIKRLLHDRSARDRDHAFVVEGIRNFIAVCDAGLALDAIVHAPPLLRHGTAEKLVRHRRRDGVPVRRVSPEQFRSVSSTDRASGLAAIVRQHVEDELPARSGGTPFWLVLSRMRKPGNVGLPAADVTGVGWRRRHPDRRRDRPV